MKLLGRMLAGIDHAVTTKFIKNSGEKSLMQHPDEVATFEGVACLGNSPPFATLSHLREALFWELVASEGTCRIRGNALFRAIFSTCNIESFT
jgi:hypothetical protein